jgi:hypothetical protein
MLMCTQVFLAGDVGLLESLVGKNVKLFGHEELLPGATCTLVKVDSVADPPPASLDWCGSATPGCDLRFVICPGGVSQYWLWVSGGFRLPTRCPRRRAAGCSAIRPSSWPPAPAAPPA